MSLPVPWARWLDAAVNWRLGMVPFDVPPELTFPAVDPAAFWRESRIHAPAGVHVVRDLGRSCQGRVRIVDLEGPSAGPGRHPGSAKLIARGHLQHPASGAPLVLLLHGFAVPSPLYDERFARQLAAAGAHVVRMDLPFHLRRRIAGQCSGAGYFGADLELVRASIRQSVEDAAAILAWARRELTSAVAMVGFSLGGLVALLLAAHVDVEALVALVPFCDPPDTFLNHLPGRARRRIGLVGEAGGIWGTTHGAAEKVLRAGLAPLVPANFVPVTAGGRMTLVTAGLDTIVGTRPIFDLAGRWGTDRWDYPNHGHLSVMSARGLSMRIQKRLLPETRLVPDAAAGTVAGAVQGALYVAGAAVGRAGGGSAVDTPQPTA